MHDIDGTWRHCSQIPRAGLNGGSPDSQAPGTGLVSQYDAGSLGGIHTNPASLLLLTAATSLYVSFAGAVKPPGHCAEGMRKTPCGCRHLRPAQDSSLECPGGSRRACTAADQWRQAKQAMAGDQCGHCLAAPEHNGPDSAADGDGAIRCGWQPRVLPPVDEIPAA